MITIQFTVCKNVSHIKPELVYPRILVHVLVEYVIIKYKDIFLQLSETVPAALMTLNLRQFEPRRKKTTKH